MCWKHEWAKAINNLEWAKIHIERAKLKVEKRGLAGAAESCRTMIQRIEREQETLRELIKDFGISKTENPPSLERNMTGQRTKSGKIQSWVNTN